MTKRLLLVAVIAAAALLAAGCGGSDDGSSGATPTEEWADGFCSAIVTWKNSLTETVSALQDGNLNKESITSAVEDATAATETFTSDLGDLGRPDTEAGQEAKDAVDDLSTQIEADMEKIQSALDDASGVAGVLGALPVISTTIQEAGQQVAATLSSLEDIDAKGELEDAFEASSSCSELS